ncbi:tetratricopeptide repeat protein, partial [Microbispora sp. H13382]|uniref:tetratricopeptide repeat protein n=1 Tax=Microbispora sp. H13382 TaxID=2729112 RepID=UPI0016045946
MQEKLFVGRRAEIAAADAMLAPDSPIRILSIYGTSGIGKTRLLAEIGAYAVDQYRYQYDAIDLSAGGQGARPDGFDQSLLGDLVTVLLRLSHTSQSKQAERRKRFNAHVREALDSLKLSSGAVQIHMTATQGGRIAESPISNRSGHPAADLYVAYRTTLVNAAIDAIADLPFTDSLITLDGIEWLTRHDDIQTGNPREGLKDWLTHKVLPEIMIALPELRFILAGWERLRPSVAIQALTAELQLNPWSPEETTEYLNKRGLADSNLATTAHAICEGTPAWLGMLADACQLNDHNITDLQWLSTVAHDRPAHEWLYETLFSRLSPKQQEVVRAAAVLRHVTHDALRGLLAPEKVDNKDFAQLCRYSFVHHTPAKHHAPQRRVHDLVRAAVLADGHRSPSLIALHQAAATWHVSNGDYLEAAYHYFAIGDPAGLGVWEESVDQALQGFDLATVQSLLETAIAPETGGRARLEATGMARIVDLYQGRLIYFIDNLDMAEPLLTSALRGFRSVSDRPRQAKAHRWLGSLYRLRGDYVRAEQEIGQALLLYLEIGNREGEADARSGLGVVYRLRGDYSRAEQEFTQALTIYQGMENRASEAYAQSALGVVYRLRGDYTRARDKTAEALRIYQEVGNRRSEADAHRDLGIMYREQKEYRQADHEVRQALAIYQEVGNRTGEADAYRDLGIAHREQGDYVQAERETSQALHIYREIGNRRGEAYSHSELGVVYRQRGDYARAGEEISQALVIYQETGNRASEADAYRDLGIAHREQGDYVQAERETSQAL